MKTYQIRKNHEFSENANVHLHIGTKQIHIKGFGSFSLSLSPGEEFFASHLWTKSNIITYEELANGSSFVIKPRLNKLLAFISFLITVGCLCLFIFTKNRWSFIPLAPIVIYVAMYLSIFKNKYLIIKQEKEE